MSPGRPEGPLLAVKYAMPPVRDGVLARGRLEERLGGDARLTLVAAPAGWGKTSLVSRWAAAAGHPIAWVSLDEGDDEPVRFWSYVLAALRRAADGIGGAPGEALGAGDGPIALALPLLLNELAELSAPIVLVLDDYQVITHAEVHEGLEFLITHLPAAVRIVLLTRTDPPLPLARMRGRGELAEVRAADLRFSPPESIALLSSVSRSAVEPDAARRILDRTEGWAAGLQLAGLALTESAARGRPVGDLGGERHLFDYFTSEVLPAFAPEQRDLLVRAAPLATLSGSLCDAALGVEGSAAVLGELERAGLFVVALDAEGEWFRCHPLLRSALGWTPLAEPEPDAAPREVLRRAARWYADHDRIDEAARALLDAREADAAAELLAAGWRWFVERGWATTLLDLSARLPEASVSTGMALSLAYVTTTCGREDRIDHWLDLAARSAGPDSVVSGWASARAAELSIRGLYATDLTRPDRAVALLEEAVALEAAAGSPDHPTAMIGLADAYGFAGRFAEATEILARFWRDRDSYPLSTSVAVQAVGVLVLFLAAAGDTEQLDRILPQAVAAADEVERTWGAAAAGPVIAVIRIVQGRRSYETGDLDAAERELARGLRLAQLASHALWLVTALVSTADLRLAVGDRRGAREALVRAREAIDTEPVPPFLRGWVEAGETRIGRAASLSATRAGTLFEELTDRELSILRMLPGSATQREIGGALFLSINTVKGYTKSLYRKLRVGGRQEAVAAARQLGLI